MRIRLVLIATTLATLLPASGAAAAFFAAEPIDGPSPDIRSVGDVDVARDGNGVVGYVRRDGGVDHLFASRLVAGAWQPPERIDVGLDAPASQPAVAATEGGRLVVAFVAGGQVWSSIRPSPTAPWTPPQPLGAPASDPSVDISVNGIGYVTFTQAGDVRAARMDRGATGFNLLPMPLDIDPAAAAGVGTGRSRVAVSADGTAVATWGESGHVYARRLFGLSVSTAPVDLTLPDLDGHAGGVADSPDVDIEDDSSFAWIAFRQAFADAGGPRTHAIARRLRGSRLEDPVWFDGLGWGGEGADAPDIDLDGRGNGIATAGTTGGSAMAGVIKDDKLNGGIPLGGSGAPAQPVGAVAETTDRVVGWVSPGDGTVHGVYYDDRPDTRVVPGPTAETVLSNPAFGPVDTFGGFDVAGDRAGDFAFVFVQGTGDGRRLVAAAYARPPGSFGLYTSAKTWRNVVKAPLAWSPSLALWGPLTYTILVDGKPVATTGDTKAVLPPGAVSEGVHTWRVTATDRRGQVVTTAVRPLKVDTVAPTVSMSIKRGGRATQVTTRAADVLPPSGRAAGIKNVRIDFGDGSAPVDATRATHTYGRGGAFTIRATATDGAGNVTVAERHIRIGA